MTCLTSGVIWILIQYSPTENWCNGLFPKALIDHCTFSRALCYLNLKRYKEAIQDCTEALKLDTKNVKAFYRRAQAYKELKVRNCVKVLGDALAGRKMSCSDSRLTKYISNCL